MSDFYYSDSCFQLELNLQETRRELIALIEACEMKDGDLCNDIECCCSDTESRDDGDTDHEPSNVPPQADLLPKPKWTTSEAQPTVSSTDFKYDVQSWLKAGLLNNQLNTSEISSPRTAYKKSENIKKSPSSKMAGQSVFDMIGNKSYIESTGKEFCLKFAENTYNLDVIMKTSAVNMTGNAPYYNIANINPTVSATSSRNAVEAFFRSFKDAMPSTSRARANATVPIDDLTNSVQKSPKHERDYAYF